jgi:uncharacterized protein (DUF4415 family)
MKKEGSRRLGRTLKSKSKRPIAAPELSMHTRKTPKPRSRIFGRRSAKQQLTLRLDADIIAWFKKHTKTRGYQTEMNRALRLHIDRARSRNV